MKIFLTSAYPHSDTDNFAAAWLKESAISDPYKKHEVCSSPAEADIVLFTEHHPPYDPYFFDVLATKTYKKFKSKCLIYHDNPKVLPLLPGVFPSIEKKYYLPEVMQPGPYIARLCTNEAIAYTERTSSPKFLFSFIGASITHPVRRSLLKLKHEKCFLKDTSGKNSWELDPVQKEEFEAEYAKISSTSLFVLCPRGIGPNSYRLFETMEMGVVPVIISDEWVPMEGPDWERFSIWVSESDVERIPEILEKRKPEAKEMGRKAREAWEIWFSKEACFHHIAEACSTLQENRSKNSPLLWTKVYRQFLRPYHFRNLLRYLKQRVKEKIKISQLQLFPK